MRFAVWDPAALHLLATNTRTFAAAAAAVLLLQGGKPGSSSFKSQREAQRKGDAGNRCASPASRAAVSPLPL